MNAERGDGGHAGHAHGAAVPARIDARFALAIGLEPRAIDVSAVGAFLRARPGVRTVHDLHVWSLSTTRVALTAHLVMPTGANHDGFIDDVTHALHERFGIAHATLQIETGACAHGCEIDA